MKRKAIITSISSLKLTQKEELLLRDKRPWGIILFKRNIKNFHQLKNLTSHIRYIMKDKRYPIMVDEEGGNVSRLSNLIDTSSFSQKFFGDLFEKNKNFALSSYKEYLYFTCGLLKKCGININTIPVLDILKNETHDVIGDRSYSKNVKTINILKKTCFETLNRFKIGSVSKHIPGHGSSKVDTHKKVSVISLSLKKLFNQDFNIFKNIDSKFVMTAHIIYKRVDPINTATHSKIVIKNIIRKRLMFKGIVISDDISMKSLPGNLLYNAQKAINSGCNLVLYCGGKINESSELLRKIDYIDKFTTKKTSEFYKFLI